MRMIWRIPGETVLGACYYHASRFLFCTPFGFVIWFTTFIVTVLATVPPAPFMFTFLRWIGVLVATLALIGSGLGTVAALGDEPERH